MLSPHSSPQQNFRIFWVGTHFGGNKEACLYPAIKSYNMMYFQPSLIIMSVQIFLHQCLLSIIIFCLQVRHNNVVHLGEKYRYTRKEENKVLSYSTLNGSIIECAHCSYACDRSDRMKKHFLTVHQNERPFSCDKCDKTFKVKDKRDLHVNTV